jgi:hypothetical protein
VLPLIASFDFYSVLQNDAAIIYYVNQISKVNLTALITGIVTVTAFLIAWILFPNLSKIDPIVTRRDLNESTEFKL